MTRCPNCGHDVLKIEAVEDVVATVSFADDDDHEMLDCADGDITWDDDSRVECSKCEWLGTLGEATVVKKESESAAETDLPGV